MRRTIRGVFLIVLGLVLSVSAAVIFAMYEHQADIAGENAEILLESLTEQIRKREEQRRTDPVQWETADCGDAVQHEPQDGAVASEREETVAQLPRLTLSGYDLVGIVRVPSLKLELPVLNTWDYDLLQIAPCRYSGSVQGGDLILLGHNYERHFGTLKQIAIGDRVEFCDVNGTVYEFTVKQTEVLQKTELERLTGSECALTLFTCTTGGYSRFVVRCMPAEEAPEQYDQ